MARDLNGIWLVDPDDGALTELAANDDFPYTVNSFRWAPDGRAVLYQRSYGHSFSQALYRINLDGSFHGPLTPLGLAGACGASWSPDGGQIAFLAPFGSDGQPFGLYLMDPDGTNRRFLTVGHGVAWSPQGNAIAFAGGLTHCHWPAPYEVGAIYLINPDGSDRRQLSFPAEHQFDEEPTWSPDGTRLAFVRHEGSGNFESGAIYVINADGTGEHLVATLPEYPSAPTWSHDGLHLAIANRRGIHLVSPDGSDLRAIEGEDVCCPTWRP